MQVVEYIFSIFSARAGMKSQATDTATLPWQDEA